MFVTICAIAFIGLSEPSRPIPPEVAALFAAIDTLQQPIADFQCEFEGQMRFLGQVAASVSATTSLGPDGLYETVSGRFLSNRAGDVYTDILHRAGSGGMMNRETVVVRVAEGQAEQYLRGNDAPLGAAQIKKPSEVAVWQRMAAGQLFLIQGIKHDIENGLEIAVHDDQLDGRPHKVVDASIQGRRWPVSRYWIDMTRSGQGVRWESYSPEGLRSGWVAIQLAPFQVGGTPVWMPVAGESAGYAAMQNGLPVVTPERTSSRTMTVVGGTMLFNQHLGRDVFTIKYKPKTAISDAIRQMKIEFGQAKVSPRPSKAEASRMLEEQLKRAEKQKSELVAVPPSGGISWSSWLAGACLLLVLTGLIAFGLQNRRRYGTSANF